MEQTEITTQEVVKTKGRTIAAEVTGISTDGDFDMLEIVVCFDRNTQPELFQRALVGYMMNAPIELIVPVDDEEAPKAPVTRKPRAKPAPKAAGPAPISRRAKKAEPPKAPEQQALVAN